MNRIVSETLGTVGRSKRFRLFAIAGTGLLVVAACTSASDSPPDSSADTLPSNTETVAGDSPSETSESPSDDTTVEAVEPQIPIVRLSSESTYVDALCATDPLAHLSDPEGLAAYADELREVPTDEPAEADELAELIRRVDRVASENDQPEDLDVVADVLRARCGP